MEIFGQTDRNKGGAWPKAFVNILTHFLPLKNGKITPNMTNFISYILFLVCLSSFTFLFVTQAIASGSKLSWLSFSQEREQLIESDKTWSSFCLFSKSQHIFDPSLIETNLFSLLRLAWLAWEGGRQAYHLIRLYSCPIIPAFDHLIRLIEAFSLFCWALGRCIFEKIFESTQWRKV